ncbi:MAG: ATP-binding protein [Streptomyces sp.]|nr:ATP-binding protein [Streptomyces sp.]
MSAAPKSSPDATDVEWRLSRHPRGVGRARTLLRAQAGVWQLSDDTAETAVLLLSELVTNAVRHSRVGGRYIGTRCVLRADALRVEVSDAGDGLPALRTARDDEEAGRGLALVQALSTAWSADPRPYGIGKTVWFELSVRRGGVAPPA